MKPSERAAVIETDFVSAFDFMSTSWILKVLCKKGCSKQFIKILQNPTCGPHHPLLGGPKPVEEKLTVLGFVDDVKGIVTSIKEFNILDKTLDIFEKAMGSKLHRSTDPNNQKCSLLTLGKWARWSEADSPLNYTKVVGTINLLSVKLERTTTRTREINKSELVSSVQSKLNHFKAGRHSALVLKPQRHHRRRVGAGQRLCARHGKPHQELLALRTQVNKLL